MDDLELLSRMRADVPDVDPLVLRRARRELLARAVGPRLVRTRRRRMVNRVAVAAGLGALLAVGLVATDSLTSGGRPVTGATAEAADLLNQAATHATDPRIGPGQYRYVVTHAWYSNIAGDSGHSFLSEQRYEEWGYNFADNSVHDQLVQQHITIPAAGSDALKPPEIGNYLNRYAGQQVTNGAQAEAYANHFIAVHLAEIGGGKTYSELSAQALANPTDTALAGKVQTIFRGETLRGLLLNAYAFWKIGQIARIAALCAFVASGLMLLLTALGLLHMLRTDTSRPAFRAAPVDVPTEVTA